MMVIVCVIVVVSAISFTEFRTKTELASDALSARAQEVTGLLAMQIGGLIKFGNADAVYKIVSKVMHSAEPDALGTLVLSASGDILYTTDSGGFDWKAARALANEALKSGGCVSSVSGLLVAFPVTFGNEGAIAGVVVTAWSGESQLARLNEL